MIRRASIPAVLALPLIPCGCVVLDLLLLLPAQILVNALSAVGDGISSVVAADVRVDAVLVPSAAGASAR